VIGNAARIVLATLVFALAMTVADRGGSTPPEPAACPAADVRHHLATSGEPAGPAY
jgi:hypothetical protein